MNVGNFGLLTGMAQSYLNARRMIKPPLKSMVDAVALAQAESVAMTTPITPESLEADGWADGSGEFGGSEYTCDLGPNDRISVWFANDLAVVAVVSMGRRTYAPGTSTMYDLRQLERLIGGAR